MTEAVPSLLADRYLMGAELGTGGMARVYRAWDGVLHREVAVKLLRQVVGDPQARERFEREGRFMAMLDHPGLVPVLDAGTIDDHPFLVLQLVRGTSLGDYYRATRPDLGETARIGAALADALAYVHAQGIVHRDVKPGNVLVRDDGQVMLTDFGIARLLGDTSRLTSTGIVLGTAAYLAPEQVRGLPGTAAADIYALALVLMEMIAGRPVFSGSPDVAALARLVAPPVVPEHLPAPLRNLLRAMTADAAVARPSADDVAGRLRTLTDDDVEPVSQTAETFRTAPLPVRWRPSRPLVLGLASGAAALALVPIIALTAGNGPRGSAWLPGAGAEATPSADGNVSRPASTVRPATQPGTTQPGMTPPRTTQLSTTQAGTTQPNTTQPSTTQGTATPSVLPTSGAVTSAPADDKDNSGKSNNGKHKGKGKGKDNSG